jgi:hypothetical protein
MPNIFNLSHIIGKSDADAEMLFGLSHVPPHAGSRINLNSTVDKLQCKLPIFSKSHAISIDAEDTSVQFYTQSVSSKTPPTSSSSTVSFPTALLNFLTREKGAGGLQESQQACPNTD